MTLILPRGLSHTTERDRQMQVTLQEALLILHSEFTFCKASNKCVKKSIGNNELMIYICSGKQSEWYLKFSSAKLLVTEADLFRCACLTPYGTITTFYYPFKMLSWIQNMLTWKIVSLAYSRLSSFYIENIFERLVWFLCLLLIIF